MRSLNCYICLLATIATLLVCLAQGQSTYMIGTGIADVTGPAAEVGMMGYAMVMQRTSGIHTRLRSRAFIIGSGSSRVVFVSSDLCFITQAVKQVVIEKLQKIYGPTLYTEENVMLSATHTHAGPGGYSWHPLYDISTFGFHDQNFEAITNGIVSSIQKAHNNLAPGVLTYNTGEISDTSINRSPSSYLANPASERAQYKYDTDHELTVLKFTSLNGTTPKEVGVVGWFAVHGTSMNNTNLYISGDNKGYASYLFEKEMNDGALPGTGPFVAAFAQSNEGDASPNTKGAFCDNGLPCDFAYSTCGGYSQGCHGYGPGNNEFESTRIIGNNQVAQLKKYYELTSKPIQGSVKHMHLWVDMEHVSVSPEYSGTGKAENTCIGALGDSFAAGTTDGPGEFDFTQGVNNSNTNWYWNWLTSKILAAPTAEDLACHYPKPILFMSGSIKFPGKWTQGIIPIQIFNVGQLWIVAVPGEFTTMAGRRLRNRIQQSLVNAGAWNSESRIVLAGLSNSYTHYITTRQEYAYQRYEAASTLFGPFTLNAYEMLYSDLARRMAKGLNPPVSAVPENMTSAIFYLQPASAPDTIPEGKNYGDVAVDALPSYSPGQTVSVSFWTGNPRANLRTEGTFLEVKWQNPNTKNWETVANDGDWETKYWFKYLTPDVGAHADIKWDIPYNTKRGTFKIVHYGDWKDKSKNIHPFQGETRPFQVL